MSESQTLPRRSRTGPKLLSMLLGAAALLTVFGIVRAPAEAFRASLSGLQVWWQYVFPGLLPPLLLAELLAASGLLHGLSTLAEPLTSRLFKLPGAAGWAIAIGWSAGVPAGAKETARLRQKGLIRADHIDTLLLLSHFPNPFFVIVIVGTGFLHSPVLGWAILLGLWLSAVVAGVIWSRISKSNIPQKQFQGSYPSCPPLNRRTLLRHALKAATNARREDGRPFGKLLADGVTQSVGLLMAVGGFMMMSAVALQLVRSFVPGSDAWLTVPGVYEMHLGAFETGRSALFAASPVHAAALLAGALAWTGFSGLLQARAAFGLEERFPWGRFLAGRLLHAALALLFTWPLADAALHSNWLAVGYIDVFATGTNSSASSGPFPESWRHLPAMWLTGIASIGVFLLLALLAAIIRPPRKKDAAPPS